MSKKDGDRFKNFSKNKVSVFPDHLYWLVCLCEGMTKKEKKSLTKLSAKMVKEEKEKREWEKSLRQKPLLSSF